MAMRTCWLFNLGKLPEKDPLLFGKNAQNVGGWVLWGGPKLWAGESTSLVRFSQIKAFFSLFTFTFMHSLVLLSFFSLLSLFTFSTFHFYAPACATLTFFYPLLFYFNYATFCLLKGNSSPLGFRWRNLNLNCTCFPPHQLQDFL